MELQLLSHLDMVTGIARQVIHLKETIQETTTPVLK